MAGTSITSTLGAGSGIDLTSLVTQLVAAQFDTKTAALTKKSDTLTAQISAAATLQSGVTSFSTSLQTLVQGGTLMTTPTSSNTSVLTATALSGAKLATLSAQVQVQQLAGAQAATTSATGLTKTSTIGNGTLSLQFGTATVNNNGAMTAFAAGSADPIPIPIDNDHMTLEGIASAINAAAAGITASIVSDANGSRLTIKSATGEAQAFTLTATEGDTPGLSALNIGMGATGTSIGSTARDAIVAVDGVALKRPTNSISDLIDGVKLNLISTSPTPVTLGSTRPTSAITQAVTDFVSAYNDFYATVKTDTDSATGVLNRDTATTNLARGLQGLTLATMNSTTDTAAPKTLAGVGVTTNRDGTLSVDSTKLAKALSDYPDAVEAMFADGGGLPAAMAALATNAKSASYGFAASTLRFNQSKSDIATEQAKVADQVTDMTTRLTAQFSKMDAAVAAYKSTGAFLTQQVAAWNAS